MTVFFLSTKLAVDTMTYRMPSNANTLAPKMLLDNVELKMRTILL